MGLYDRILGLEQPKIPVHAFGAALQERALGNVTTAQLVNAFALDATAQADLTTLFATLPNNATTTQKFLRAIEVENVMILGESGIAFTTVAAIKDRLGVT
jgi:hypothetical protein